VDHEFDSLGVFGIHVPVDFFETVFGVASRDVHNSGLALLEVAFGINTGAAGKTKKFRLRTDNGLVDSVDIGTTGDGKIRVIAAFLKAVKLVNMILVYRAKIQLTLL
jgi:hypothetical protein